jgi:hypothetical protein
MTSDKERKEFERKFQGLSEKSKLEEISYLQELAAFDRSRLAFPPPTPEQWHKVPSLVKWHICLMLIPYAVQAWLAELGLKIGGK